MCCRPTISSFAGHCSFWSTYAKSTETCCSVLGGGGAGPMPTKGMGRGPGWGGVGGGGVGGVPGTGTVYSFTMRVLLTSLLAAVKEYGAASLRTEQAKKLGIAERLAKEQAARLGSDHMDTGAVKVFPVPLIILGGMYDTFQNFDPEKKKVICRTLRFIAHSHGATLQFYSTMDTGLVKKVNSENVNS